MAIIEVRNLKKQFKVYKRESGLKGALKALISRKYKIINAINNISFEIERGEIIGMIGPNGAGKSTTIKILTGILYPTSGYVRVLDFDPFEEREEYTKHIGVVFGQRTQLWWDLPVRESFNLLEHIYEIPESRFRKNLKRFIKILDLEKVLSTPVRKLSLGQRVKCDLAASLLHDPDVIFLDEPTIGLDVIAKERIRKFIKERNKKGVTVILTTHDMGDIEELSKRMIIIDKGRKIYDGSIDEIKKRFVGYKLLVVEFHDDVKPKIKGTEIVRRLRNKFWFRVDSKRVTDVVDRILSNYSVHDISIEEPKIEGIIQRIYKSGLR